MSIFSSSISSNISRNIRSGRNANTSATISFSASSTPRDSWGPFAHFSVAMLFLKIVDIAA
jgi:hypothetical protein